MTLLVVLVLLEDVDPSCQTTCPTKYACFLEYLKKTGGDHILRLYRSCNLLYQPLHDFGACIVKSNSTVGFIIHLTPELSTIKFKNKCYFLTSVRGHQSRLAVQTVM